MTTTSSNSSTPPLGSFPLHSHCLLLFPLLLLFLLLSPGHYSQQVREISSDQNMWQELEEKDGHCKQEKVIIEHTVN